MTFPYRCVEKTSFTDSDLDPFASSSETTAVHFEIIKNKDLIRIIFEDFPAIMLMEPNDTLIFFFFTFYSERGGYYRRRSLRFFRGE